MACLALSLQPTNGSDNILLQTREWFPPARALVALSAFRQTRLSYTKHAPSTSTHPSHDISLGDDPLAASSGQLIVGVESKYRVVYRLVNGIYILGITTVDEDGKDVVVNNVFECIGIVNQAVSVVVAACRGVDVTPEKLHKKYAEIYMALDIVLKGVSSIRLSAMLASMHGEGIAKMVGNAVNTESRIRGAENWGSVEVTSVEREVNVEVFTGIVFELPAETLAAGDEFAATIAPPSQEREKEEMVAVEEGEEGENGKENDPFAASDAINKPIELVGGFKKNKDISSDLSVALTGLEITTLPPASATQPTTITAEGFEGDYGGVEFSTEKASLNDDFEGFHAAFGGGLDASEFLGSEKVKKSEGLGGLEFLGMKDPLEVAVAANGTGGEKLENLVTTTEMKGPEMYISEEISVEFRESVLARVGLMGVVYLRTIPPIKAGDKETEFSFRVDNSSGALKRVVIQNSSVSSLGDGMFHVRTPSKEEPIPLLKYSLLPRLTPLPLRVRLVKRHTGKLLSVMIQYVSNPDLPVPLTDVTFILKIPVDPTLLQAAPKAILNRSEKEIIWHIGEVPLKGPPGQLKTRMPVDASEQDSDEEVEVFGMVQFSMEGNRTLSGVSLRPISEGKTDFYEVSHKLSSGIYTCN